MIGCASSPRRFIVALHYVLMRTDGGRKQLGPGELGGDYIAGRDRVHRCSICERPYALADVEAEETLLVGQCPTCRTVSRKAATNAAKLQSLSLVREQARAQRHRQGKKLPGEMQEPSSSSEDEDQTAPQASPPQTPGGARQVSSPPVSAPSGMDTPQRAIVAANRDRGQVRRLARIARQAAAGQVLPQTPQVAPADQARQQDGRTPMASQSPPGSDSRPEQPTRSTDRPELTFDNAFDRTREEEIEWLNRTWPGWNWPGGVDPALAGGGGTAGATTDEIPVGAGTEPELPMETETTGPEGQSTGS
jgi:hypothetical protein